MNRRTFLGLSLGATLAPAAVGAALAKASPSPGAPLPKPDYILAYDIETSPLNHFGHDPAGGRDQYAISTYRVHPGGRMELVKIHVYNPTPKTWEELSL